MGGGDLGFEIDDFFGGFFWIFPCDHFEHLGDVLLVALFLARADFRRGSIRDRGGRGRIGRGRGCSSRGFLVLFDGDAEERSAAGEGVVGFSHEDGEVARGGDGRIVARRGWMGAVSLRSASA